MDAEHFMSTFLTMDTTIGIPENKYVLRLFIESPAAHKHFHTNRKNVIGDTKDWIENKRLESELPLTATGSEFSMLIGRIMDHQDFFTWLLMEAEKEFDDEAQNSSKDNSSAIPE